MSPNNLDRRLNAVRDDLADEAFKDKISATKFVSFYEAQVISNTAPIKRQPSFDAALDTELLFGEVVKVFDESEGWSWVQSTRDSYVGYIPSDCLTQIVVKATHRVKSLRTFVYPTPDIKTPPADFLSINSLVTVAEEKDNFVKLNNGYFLYKSHLTAIDEYETDFVEVARRFIGVPYLWGGRSSLGIDCSGLVQMALQSVGNNVLRDSDMLEGHVGYILSEVYDVRLILRGDLVFWKGHVGIMVDPETLLHANGYHMDTVEESITGAIERIQNQYGSVTCFKRLAEQT